MSKEWKWERLSNPIKEDGSGMQNGDPSTRQVNITGPGVYVIYKNENNIEIPVYVGKSDKSVFERMDRHCSNNEKYENYDLYKFIQERERISYYVLLEDNAENRSDYEYTLYDKYGGKEELLNKKDPDEGDCVYMVFPL